MGRLEIIYGPMFSGKTTALLQKLTEFNDIGFNVVYINHAIDTRNTTQSFSTHSSYVKHTKFPFTQCQIHTLCMDDVHEYDVIGIDEAQFFDETIINFCETMVVEQNKIVIVAGLSGTFERKKFGYILDLIPMSEKQISLHAYCKRCFDERRQAIPAYFSFRLTESKNVVEVGDGSMYIPVCSNCHKDLSTKQS